MTYLARTYTRPRPHLSLAQDGIMTLVTGGIGAVAELEAELTQQGIQRSRRALQRLLQRMCRKGYLAAVRFPKETGRRGYFHVATTRGIRVYQATQELQDAIRLSCPGPANPRPLPDCPRPAWVEEALAAARARKLAKPRPAKPSPAKPGAANPSPAKPRPANPGPAKVPEMIDRLLPLLQRLVARTPRGR
jgi:hypothetical protein